MLVAVPSPWTVQGQLPLHAPPSSSPECTAIPPWGPRICKKTRKEQWDARCPAWKMVFWLL